MEKLDLQPVEYARVLCTSQDLTIARVVPTRKVRAINDFVCLFFFSSKNWTCLFVLFDMYIKTMC